jgi:GST-like protein
MIEVYFINSPNGRKVSIMLGETGLEHRLIHNDSGGVDILDAAFRKISANSRLPAIVDHDPLGGGPPLPLFESGAILIYLAEKAGKLLPEEPRARHTTLQWLMWQMAGIGPMHGQAHHFSRYAPDPVDPYALQRFRREAERLLFVMNRRLAESPYLGGEAYSIADIACWPWIEVLNVIEMDRGGFEHIERWFQTIAARPGVQEGCRFPLHPMMRRPGRIHLSRDVFSRAFGEELHRRSRLD